MNPETSDMTGNILLHYTYFDYFKYILLIILFKAGRFIVVKRFSTLTDSYSSNITDQYLMC